MALNTTLASMARVDSSLDSAVRVLVASDFSSSAMAASFSRFYDLCHILSESDPARQSSWLGLSDWTLRALERLLDLLGIEVPDRM